MRPLTAAPGGAGRRLRAVGRGPRHERPIGDLVDALRQLGCDIRLNCNRRLPRSHRHPPRCGWTRRFAVRGRRVKPVPDRVADGAAAAATTRCRREVVGELISKPLHRDHVEPWRASASLNARVGNASSSPRAAATGRPARSMSRPMRRRELLSRSVPGKADECRPGAHPGRGRRRSRGHPLHGRGAGRMGAQVSEPARTGGDQARQLAP